MVLQTLLTQFIFVVTFIYMIIEFDTTKREKTLLERGLDFADSGKVLEGLHFNARDDRFDYGEDVS